MGEVSRLAKVAPLLVVVAITGGCSIGGPSTFTLNSASVDESYVCPTSANDLAYTLHATIGVHNGTSSVVTIRSVEVVMTLASVKGGWLEHVGARYDAGGVTVSPGTVGAGSTASVIVSAPTRSANATFPSLGPTMGIYRFRFRVARSPGPKPSQ